MAITIRITRRRCPDAPWVVDYFDPRTGCRYEIFLPTRAEALACRLAILRDEARP